MSAEPKHVFDYTEWDTGISKCRHPSHIAGYSATCWEASANKAGWVSPEEATAREAAARREALLEAREDIRARRRNFRDLNADPEYLAAMDDAFGLVNNRLRAANRALAEPERDEEGGR